MAGPISCCWIGSIRPPPRIARRHATIPEADLMAFRAPSSGLAVAAGRWRLAENVQLIAGRQPSDGHRCVFLRRCDGTICRESAADLAQLRKRGNQPPSPLAGEGRGERTEQRYHVRK